MNEGLDKMISRRSLLKGAAAAMGVALVSTFAGKALAAKSTKAAFKYQDSPKGDKKCSNCRMFIPGKTPTEDGTCQLVEGTISPEGYCTAWYIK